MCAVRYHGYIVVEAGQQLLLLEACHNLQSWRETREEVRGWLIVLSLQGGGVPPGGVEVGGGHTKQPEESRSEGMMLFGPHPTDRTHLSRSQCFSIVADIHIPLIFCQISLALLLLEQGMCVSKVRYNQDISSRKSRSGFPEQ